MKRPTPTQRLKQDIALLELKRQDDWIALKYDFEAAKESLNPLHLIKGLVGEGTETGEAIKTGVSKAAIGLGTGWILKKLLFNAATKSPLMAIAGTIFQTAATGFVAKNSDAIQSGVGKFIGFLRNKLARKTATV